MSRRSTKQRRAARRRGSDEALPYCHIDRSIWRFWHATLEAPRPMTPGEILVMLKRAQRHMLKS